MSGFVDLTPSPFQLGAMGPNDQDGSWLIDCTEWCNARGVTLVSIGTPIVQRRDGVTTGAGDVILTGASVVTITTTVNGITSEPGFGFIFNATTNGNSTTYYLGFPLTDSVGNVVTRNGELPVIPFPG